jgi:hypothetical protein
MAKISELITAKAALLQDEFLRIQAGTLNKEDAKNVQEMIRKSQAAIFGGRKSDAWEAYMRMFAGGDQANMDKLCPPKPDPDETRERARCYLVRNGRCSEGTTPNILNTVENKLD